MNCPSIPDHVYGFLDAAGHLAECDRCREAAARLSRERDLLARAAARLAVAPARRRPWIWTSAAALLLVGLAGWIAIRTLPKLRPDPKDLVTPLRPRDGEVGAVISTRSLDRYRMTYEAAIRVGGSEQVFRGECLWIKPGILFAQGSAPGVQDRRILRVRARTWVYHELLEDWVAAGEMGAPHAGRGIENPDDVLAILQRRAPLTDGDFRIAIAGSDVMELFPDPAHRPVDWSGVLADVRCSVREGLLSSILVTAQEPAREAALSATMRFVRAGEFSDRVFPLGLKPIRIPDHLRKEIEVALRRQ